MKAKFIYFLFCVTLIACNDDDATVEKPYEKTTNYLLENKDEISRLVYQKHLNPESIEDSAFYAELETLTISKTHPVKQNVDTKIIQSVVDKIIAVDIQKYDDIQDYKQKVYTVLDETIINKDSYEYKIIDFQLFIVFDLIDKKFTGTLTRGWWKSWGQCAAGIVGGTLGGGLGGAAAGSAIPGLGTVTGGIIGGVAGGLTGAAASCE